MPPAKKARTTRHTDGAADDAEEPAATEVVSATVDDAAATPQDEDVEGGEPGAEEADADATVVDAEIVEDADDADVADDADDADDADNEPSAAGTKRKRAAGPPIDVGPPPSLDEQSSIATSAIARAQAELAAQGYIVGGLIANTDGGPPKPAPEGAAPARGRGAGRGRGRGRPRLSDARGAGDAVEGSAAAAALPMPAEAAAPAGAMQLSFPNAHTQVRTFQLADGATIRASLAKPFLAMLPLSDQKDAKDGHVLMMPVQLSYQVMAVLLDRPPLDKPYMPEREAVELSDHMEALRPRRPPPRLQHARRPRRQLHPR